MLFAALVAWSAVALAAADGEDAVSYVQHSMALQHGRRAGGHAEETITPAAIGNKVRNAGLKGFLAAFGRAPRKNSDRAVQPPQPPKAASILPAIVSALLPAFAATKAAKEAAKEEVETGVAPEFQTNSAEEFPTGPEIQSVLPPGKLQSQPVAKVQIPRSFSDKDSTIMKLTALQTEIAGQKRALEAKQKEIEKQMGVFAQTKKLTSVLSRPRTPEDIERDYENQLQEVTAQKANLEATIQKGKVKAQAALEASKAEVATLAATVKGMVQGKELVAQKLQNVSAQYSELEAYTNKEVQLVAGKQMLIKDVTEMNGRLKAQAPRIANLTTQKQQLEFTAARAPKKLGQTNNAVEAIQEENKKLEEALAKLLSETKEMSDTVEQLQKKAQAPTTPAP